MTDYTIAAIPTMYNGRQYRSRLEAKWAAFFTLLGWRFEYEPFELGKWSPDFLLSPPINSPLPAPRGPTGVLVEIKPITSIEDATIEKMYDAAERHQRREWLLLVGTSPILRHPSDRSPQIGWVSPPAHWTLGGIRHGAPSSFKAFYDPRRGVMFDFTYTLNGSSGCISGYSSDVDDDLLPSAAEEIYRSDHLENVRAHAEWRDRIMGLWDDATNIVQWHPRT